MLAPFWSLRYKSKLVISNCDCQRDEPSVARSKSDDGAGSRAASTPAVPRLEAESHGRKPGTGDPQGRPHPLQDPPRILPALGLLNFVKITLLPASFVASYLYPLVDTFMAYHLLPNSRPFES